MADGYYSVDAFLVPDNREAMTVHLFLQPSRERMPGNEWPYLEYRVRA